jgi:F420-non-reducing hydrogenase iron-sulfur subunit
MENFEPTIIAFVCNWCTYTAADLAGTSRLSYPKNVRLIRVMCTGMVDPQYVIKAFLEGADGVLVSGCHPGDCHYINGNYKARRRIKLLKEILPQFGFDPRTAAADLDRRQRRHSISPRSCSNWWRSKRSARFWCPSDCP